MDESCFDIIKDVIKNRNVYQLRTTSRYCTQEKFNLIVVGGEHGKTNLVSDNFKIDGNNLSKINTVSNLNRVRKY